MIKAFLILGIVIPLLVYRISSYLDKPRSGYLLGFTVLGPAYAILYGWIGKRVARLRNKVSLDEGTAIPALVLCNTRMLPGIVILRQESLTLAPIFGKPTETTRSNALPKKEHKWFFNRQLMIGKTGFSLNEDLVSDGTATFKLGCAIPNSRVPEFKRWLSETQTDGT